MSRPPGRPPRRRLLLGPSLPFVLDCVPISVPGMPRSRFQTTSWSLVLAAAGHPTTDSRRALAALCQIYWNPVYAFIRRSGYTRDQSQDLTQGFFALLLEKQYLRDADQERGRFRSFLLTAVKHFLANEWDRDHALKRGGGQIPLSIDPLDACRGRRSRADRSLPQRPSAPPSHNQRCTRCTKPLNRSRNSRIAEESARKPIPVN